MSECKNVFSILNELMENAKEIQNEDVLKDYERKKDLRRRSRAVRLCCQRVL